MRSRHLVALAFLACGGCFPMVAAAPLPPAPVYQPVDTSQAFAASMGYPTRHTAEELEAFLAQHLAGYRPEGQVLGATLEGPVRVPVRLKRGRCYFMVLRLAAGAAYSGKAQAGFRFDFEPRNGGAQITGGPGVHGPGGAGSAGCPQRTADYDFVLRTVVGASEADLGTGPITLQLYAKPISAAQLANLKADEERQIEEARRFRAEQQAREAARAQAGCAKCDARYQGCRGAGRSVSACQSAFRSCAFEEVGASWPSRCRTPID
jgi:hypothetical protein